jgi:undecaprenyl-diphosphatase
MSMKRDWKVVWLSMLHAVRKSPRGFWLGWLLFLIVSAVLIVPYDFTLFDWIRRESPNGSRHVIKFLGEAGKFEYLNLIGTILLMGLAYLKNDRWLRRVALSFFAASAIAGISVQLVKPLVGRPRPSQVMEKHINSVQIEGPTMQRRYHSYPSGHTATTVAACSVVAIAFPRLLLPCILAALITAWARISGNSHFPIDTLHGAVLGYLCAYLCTRWLKKRHRLPDRETHAMRRQPIRRKLARESPLEEFSSSSS